MKAKILVLIVLCLVCSVIFSGCRCDHQWAEATCSTPKTCTVCKERVGDALGHEAGDWEIGEEATIFTSGTRIRKCIRCDYTVTTERYEFVKYHVGDFFVFSPSELTERYAALAEACGFNITAEYKAVENHAATVVTIGEKELYIKYYNSTEPFLEAEKDIKAVKRLSFGFGSDLMTNSPTETTQAMMLYFMAIDPELSADEAVTLFTTLTKGVMYNSEPTSDALKNGLKHNLTIDLTTGEFMLESLPEA